MGRVADYAAAMRRNPVVLMYHGFAVGPREDPVNQFVTQDALRAQLQRLASGRWRLLDLDGYLAACDARFAGRCALMTVDDAMQSFGQVGHPVFAEAGAPTVLFVAAGTIGGTTAWMSHLPDEPVLDAEALRALAGDGVEIGSHSFDHPEMIGLSDAELQRQVLGSRDRIADLTGFRPRAFAYPYGAFDERARRAVERAGYVVGFSVHRDAGIFARSRVDVNATDTTDSLRLKLLPAYRVLWRASRALPPARRMVRRLVTR